MPCRRWTYRSGAVRNHIVHQCASHAGSVSFSAVLSLFPLLLFLAAAAATLGEAGAAAARPGISADSGVARVRAGGGQVVDPERCDARCRAHRHAQPRKANQHQGDGRANVAEAADQHRQEPAQRPVLGRPQAHRRATPSRSTLPAIRSGFPASAGTHTL
jgi:hypothetical protein